MLTEKLPMRGDAKITITDVVTGKVEVIKRKNLIVTLGKKLVVRHLGGDASYHDEFLTKMGFGTSDTAPSAGDTALGAEVTEKTATITYPTDTSLKATATLATGDANGNTIKEIGLKTGVTEFLFSRIANLSIAKTATVTVTVEWTITLP